MMNRPRKKQEAGDDHSVKVAGYQQHIDVLGTAVKATEEHGTEEHRVAPAPQTPSVAVVNPSLKSAR